MSTPIRIKERRTVAVHYDEVDYTPDVIREIWSNDTAETSLVLALLERWEQSLARISQLEALCREACEIGRRLGDPSDTECPICGGCVIERDHVRRHCPGPLGRIAAIRAELEQAK